MHNAAYSACKKKLSLYRPRAIRSSMQWRRLTVNIEPAIAEAAKKQAQRERRSFAAYVATLIERDLAEKQSVDETAGEYHVDQKSKPPDKTSRIPGAGPRHRVSA